MPLRDLAATVAMLLATCLATGPAPAATSCDQLSPCAAKSCRLDAQIEQAKAGHNAKALPRLERERSEMAYCDDEGLRQKRKVALEQAQHQIDQREAELKKAEGGGNPARIKKAQRKLDSAREAYTEIENSPL